MINQNKKIIDYLKKPFSSESIIFLYITLKPIYLFSSGLPQISDMLLIAYVLYVILRTKGTITFPSKASNIFVGLFGLLSYQLLINLIWSAFVSENINKNTIFYLFNYLSFALCCYICLQIGIEKIKNIIIDGSLMSCVISAIGIYVKNDSGRSTGFFNNPNQLGYHGLLLISLVFLCTGNKLNIKAILTIIISIWLIISSASKAALIAAFILCCAYTLLVSKNDDIKSSISKMIILILIFLVIYTLLYSDNPMVISNSRIVFMRNRLLNMQGENDNDLNTGRGYGRIAEIGVHAIWGYGEGANYRFSIMTGNETHSSYASFIVSYGIIGITWLFIFMYKVLFESNKSNWIQNIVLMSGLLIYGISHNGIRNTLLWIFLAIMFMSNIANTE